MWFETQRLISMQEMVESKEVKTCKQINLTAKHLKVAINKNSAIKFQQVGKIP